VEECILIYNASSGKRFLIQSKQNKLFLLAGIIVALNLAWHIAPIRIGCKHALWHHCGRVHSNLQC